MSAPVAVTVRANDASWPETLTSRLGEGAPQRLYTIGSIDLLASRKIALLCSAHVSGDAILRAYDAAQKLRDDGVTVISGFHSPIEKDCLEILLRGKQPIIICLARAMEKIRLPSAWRVALDAALADEVLIIHATSGGQIERISELVNSWRIPVRKLDPM